MRKQRAFASLSDEEIDQISDWLLRERYEIVLERVRKPRPEGFGLNISIKPLQLLHDKAVKVVQINSLLNAPRAETPSAPNGPGGAPGGPCGEHPLTVSRLDAILAGEKEVSQEVHDAILEATCDLAASREATPAQLLSLQRLADFPARAEIREQRLQLHQEKLAQKREMDAHRKQLASQRLQLQSLALEFRLQKAQARKNQDRFAE